LKKWLISLLLILLCFGAWKGFDRYQKWRIEPDVTIMGSVNMYDGLGRQGVELLDVIKDRLRVRFNPTREVLLGDIPWRLRWLVNQKCFQFGDIIIYEDHPVKWNDTVSRKMDYAKKDGQVRIAYSMFESTRIPKYWVETFNRNFDMIVVPSLFLVETYEKSGVKKPIFYLPLGRDLKGFLDEPLKEKKQEVFTFGTFGSFIARKNHINLIRAFHKAFGNRSDVRLLIEGGKGFHNLRWEIEDELKKLGATNSEMSCRQISMTEYVKRYHKIDCLLNLSKGEGFSNQPREAMAMGIPVLVTNNTGQIEICRSGLAGVLESMIEEDAEYPEINEIAGKNFNFDVDDGAKAMQEIYDNYDAYTEKSGEMREWARQFDFKSLKPLYLTLVDPKEVVMGESNSLRDGVIETNDPELYKRYCLVLAKRGRNEKG